MTKKRAIIKKRYRVIAQGVSNDETGKRFAKGDIVTSSDFSAATLKNWAGERAAIVEVT